MSDFKTLQKQWEKDNETVSGYKKKHAAYVKQIETFTSELSEIKILKARLFQEKEDTFNLFAQGAIKENDHIKAEKTYNDALEKERYILKAIEKLTEERNKITTLITEFRNERLLPTGRRIWSLIFEDLKIELHATAMEKIERAYIAYKRSRSCAPAISSFPAFVFNGLWGRLSHSGPSDEKLTALEDELLKKYFGETLK